MRYEDGFPEPIGVFRAVEAPRYDEEFNRQIEHARKTRGPGDLNKLFNSGETWAVQPPKEVPTRVTLPTIQAGVEVDEAAGAEAGYRPIPATEVERSLLNDDVQALRPPVPVVVKPETPVREVLQLLVEKSIGCVLVADQGRPVGIFSERDALVKLNCRATELGDRPISEFMTSNPESLQKTAKVAFAVQRMDLGGFRHVPIVDNDRTLTGIISVRDILRYLTARMDTQG